MGPEWKALDWGKYAYRAGPRGPHIGVQGVDEGAETRVDAERRGHGAFRGGGGGASLKESGP